MAPRYSKIDVWQGYRTPLIKQASPLLIRDAMRRWPALSCWSVEYLALQFASRPVRLERFDPASIVSYLDQTVLDEHKIISFDCLMWELMASGSCFAVRENSDVFCENPRILNDLDDFRPFPVSQSSYKSLWIGPQGYVTGMHTDPGPTLVFQIVGSKRILLFAPSEGQHVYEVPRTEVKKRFAGSPSSRYLEPNDVDTLSGRTGWADVQPFLPDFDRYPKFALTQGVECILRPGDTVYIPDGWWHAVHALSLSISVAAEPFVDDSAD